MERRAPYLCHKAPVGWYCTRDDGHTGPCAAERIEDVAGERNPGGCLWGLLIATVVLLLSVAVVWICVRP